MNKNDKDPLKEAVSTLFDWSTDHFSEITKDKNTSLTLLGTHGKELVFEATFFDDRLKKYVLQHITVTMIRKHRLIPEEEIEIFDPYVPKEKNSEK